MSRAEARLQAIEQAKINAIENAFGKVILQGNSTYVQNSQTGEKVETNSVFNFVSDSYVNGEWVEDDGQPKIEEFRQDEEDWVRVTVSGKVRPLNSMPVSFLVRTLSCDAGLVCETDQFNDGQSLYLYFKSPQDGYVSVFIDVPAEGATYRILPYTAFASTGQVKVKADREYIFFSPRQDHTGNRGFVDELVLTLPDNAHQEANKLFILYSDKAPFDKPLLNSTASTAQQFSVLEESFKLPLHIRSEDFQRWLLRIRSLREDIQLSTAYLYIRGR